MSMIFISHRSTDKAFADLFADFLLRCDIKSEDVFCSSLPGNDIKADIPAEIKENLNKSVLNIVLLSANYYKSPFCVNEEGIIWYLNTPKVVICLPEINDKLMEGFLNSDNKIRRMDSKDDLTAIVDIVRPLFPSFVTSYAKLNTNIDKLIKDYLATLGTRTISVLEENPPKVNSLEDSILADNFLDEELAALRYLYDSKTDIFCQNSSMFSEWLKNQRIEIKSSIEIANFLFNAGIATIYNSGLEGIRSVQLTVSAYRDLMKFSKKALNFIDTALVHITKKTIDMPKKIPVANYVDQLIANRLTDNEMLFIQYVLDSERVKFMCGYQVDLELQKIKAWEEIHSICDSSLSSNYDNVTNMLLIRKIIKISQVTSGGKPKEYELAENTFEWIENLTQASKQKLAAIVEKNQLPF